MKIEAKIFTYDIEGTFINRRFLTVESESNLGQRVNKAPNKEYSESHKATIYTYITDDLNTDNEYAAKKWIIEPHRLYFFALDPKNNDVTLEFTRDLSHFIEKISVSHKLKGYRCIHEYKNIDNNIFRFGGIGESIFDKIYYVTDRDRINDARLALRDLIQAHIKELETEMAFYNNMLSKVVVDESVSSVVDKVEFINAIDNIETPKIIEELVVEKKSKWSLSHIFSKVFKGSPV